MEHEGFPAVGFEFMDEPATEQQKDVIVERSHALLGKMIDRHGAWPVPFSKWDAARMIDAIESEARERVRGGSRDEAGSDR